MRKIRKFSILICGLVALVFVLCSCDSENKRYVDDINDKLVSFADCVDALTDSLNTISEVRTVPTVEQIDEIEGRIDKLSSVCGEIQTLRAPEDYSDVQKAVAKSMGEYKDAMEKCKILMEFYRSYDAEFHLYSTPDEGSAAMEEKLNALYSEFMDAMWQARDSLLIARDKIQEN